MEPLNRCPVCGFLGLAEPPYSDASGYSYEICRSCGFQFGVSDDDEGFTYDSWRSKWIAAGLRWSSVATKPPLNRSAIDDLRAIGIEVPGRTN